MEYLVDSDWAMSYLNGRLDTRQRINGLLPYGVGISIISLAEIYEGIYGSNDIEGQEARLAEFLASLNVLYLNDAITRIFAQECRRLRSIGALIGDFSIGALIGDFDLLIGATAIQHGLNLLTNNRRHFNRLQGLSIVSE